MLMNTGAVYYGVAVACFLASIIACFKLGRRWEENNPGKLGFKWGYFFIINTALINTLIFSLAIYATLRYGEFGMFILMIALLAGLLASAHQALARRKWALILTTLLSFNIIWYIINTFYLKHRWQEISEEVAVQEGGLGHYISGGNDALGIGGLSRDWRKVLFAVTTWIIAVFIYVVIFKPYGYHLRADDYSHIMLIAFLPSGAVIFLYWSYTKFVR